MAEKLTYGDMCQVISDEWNKLVEASPNKDSLSKSTSKKIFELDPHGELFWLPYLYEVAKKGHLGGLLLTDEYYAMLFIRKFRQGVQ
jgi:hypothetical protein